MALNSFIGGAGIVRSARIGLFVMASTLGCCNGSRESTFRSGPERTAADTPVVFLVASGVGDWNKPDGSATCRSPIMDPRDGASARLVRSVPGIGDFEFEIGRYGIRRDELLRVDCRTGHAIGIVRR